MKCTLLLGFTLVTLSFMNAQNSTDLPYYELPEYSNAYTAGTVTGRLIDGLGFRYYWATEGLSDTDLEFKLGDDTRSTLETMAHIYDLSTVIKDAALQVPHTKETLKKALTYCELRALTLNNLKTASDIFKQQTDLEAFNMVFKTPNGNNTVPFWNAINGPVADAVWHCGQIASFRRASGNPINSKVNHFMGTVQK
ncbi:hypothetical protein [Formosa sp. A9]|uniref:hypothetical protein n=1 Tax=Formosa sp. A9 TaxID=3442641 RepID=UPI003EB987EE